MATKRSAGVVAAERRGWRASDAAPYGLVPALAVVLLTIIDAAETSVTSGVLPRLQQEFGFGDFAAGAIPTAGVIAGLAMILPAGYLADRANRTRLLAIVVAIWSVITLGSTVAISFAMFFLTRTVLGAAQSIDNPSVSSLLTDWYAPRARARAFGYQRVSLAVGAGIGAAVGGVVGDAVGWRWAYAVFIVPGLLVAWMIARQPEPARGELDEQASAPVAAPMIDDVGVAVDESLAEKAAVTLRDVRAVMDVGTARLLFYGLSIYASVLGAAVFWLPSLLGRLHDLSDGRAASIAAGVLGVGTLGGAIIGGELGDRWHDPARAVRMTILVVGMIVGLGLFGLSVALPALAPQIVVMLIGLGFIGMVAATFPAVIADVVPASRRGVAYSLFQLIVNVGIALGPLVIGGLSEATGSLRTAFLLVLPLAAVGTVVMVRARSHYVADMASVGGGDGSPA